MVQQDVLFQHQAVYFIQSCTSFTVTNPAVKAQF